MKPKRMDEDAIENIVTSAIEEAQSFIESEIDEDRNKAQRYYRGQVDLQADKGRSKVIATKCRDVVRIVKPSLMRVFLGSSKTFEYTPRTDRDVDAAEQATNHAAYILDRCGKFRLLADVFHDALVKKTGILKAYWDESEDVEYDEYTGLTDPEFATIAGDEDVEVIEHETYEDTVFDGMQEIPVTLHDAKVARTKTGGEVEIESIPPEDFFVDSQASCLKDAYVCGHRSEMRVGDLIEMGFDWEDVHDLGSDEDTMDDEADFARRGYTEHDQDHHARDPSMRPVTVYEAYMRMDVEGTGIPRLYKFILAGSKRRLLDYEPCDVLPFAVFEVDPEPHTFFGRSLVDLLIYDQEVMTALWRGLIDNMAMTNNPGFAYNDQNVDTDDMLNNEIGRLVRTNGQPGTDIMPLTVPFAAGQTIPAMEYFDQLLEDKTGVSRASAGLDPDSLQNTTATAVAAARGAAQEQIEMMARNLGDGVMQLAKILLQLIRQHGDAEEIIRVDGQFVPVDPSSWSADMDVVCNVGLGSGGKEERGMVLRETLGHQMQIWSIFGPGNGLVTMTNIRNTLADLNRDAGVHNVDRYWQPMDEERERLLLEQAQQQAAAQQQQSDPNAAFLQAEQLKAQAKMQTDMAKLQAEQMNKQAERQLEVASMMREDDLARDQMVQNLAIEVAKVLGQYGVQIDQNAIRREQATNQVAMRAQGNNQQ